MPVSTIVQADKIKKPLGFVAQTISSVAILSMIIPLLMIDVTFSLYQAIYFTICDIPKISKKDYITFDRGRLLKLTLLQRMSCHYCDYANGLMAWAKAVANMTEVYSCAIKHSSPRYHQSYQDGYYERVQFGG